MTSIFETHAHYDDPSFDVDRDTLLPEIHKTVGHIINCCAGIKSLTEVPKLAEKYDFMYFSAGLHPEELENATKEHLKVITDIAKHPKCVAIGEIGLDYHYDDGASAELQKQWFEHQLKIAKELELPVIIHSRDATSDTMEILRAHKPRGVMHCFSGSVETMREVIGLGMYIGLGGTVTFKNARHSVEVASEIPLDRLLLETDAPYMAPTPFRGTRNDSSLIKYVAEKIADIRSIPYDELLSITEQNAKNLFNIK